MIRFNNVKKASFILALLPIFTIFNCSPIKRESEGCLEKLEKLYSEYYGNLKKEVEREIIFIVTDYDCNVCVNSIYPWIDNFGQDEQVKEFKLSGIYFSSGSYQVFQDMIDKTENSVHWKVYDDGIPFFDQIQSCYPEKKGPFALEARDGNLKRIYSINIENYNFD